MRTLRMKVVGLLLVVAGWAVVLRGLLLLPVSNDAASVLDSGEAFFLNGFVYLPAMALTVLLAIALSVAVAARRGTAVGVFGALAVSAFTWWVLTQQALLNYIPGLRGSLLLAAGLAGVGLLAFCAAFGGRPPAESAKAALRRDNHAPR